MPNLKPIEDALIDRVALALCESFYANGSIYEEPMKVVIESRWSEWRPQAEAAIRSMQMDISPNKPDTGEKGADHD